MMGRRKLFPVPKHLKYRGIKSRTLNAYSKAVHKFFRHLTRLKVKVPKTVRRLDAVLAEYINHMWLEGEPVGYAGHLISGMKRFYPPCKNALPTTAQYFANWQREHVPNRALPLPWFVCRGIVALAIADANWSFAFVTLLAFRRFLRTMEFLCLKFEDIQVLPGHSLVITLENTKSSSTYDESLTVQDVHLTDLLEKAAKGCKKDDLIFPADASSYFNQLKDYLAVLEVKEKYTPYSLRRGGATRHYLRTRSLDDTMLIGRWKHQKTSTLR